MKGKCTAIAPANIAFVKYWGATDLARAIPANRSISMTLERCQTRSTVEVGAGSGPDELLLADADGKLTPAPGPFAARALAHLATIRRAAGGAGPFRVATLNSFPAAAGLASSASGFCALTLAAAAAAGLALDPAELSLLACQSGSGSAARSAYGGFVEWPAAFDEAGRRAVPLAPATHWELADVIAVVDAGTKAVSSREGHRRAATSPFYAERQRRLDVRLAAVRQAIAERALGTLGPILEEEAIELHLIAMSSQPAIFYWQPGTLAVLAAVRRLRDRGVPAWSTMDAGANVHVITAPGDALRVASELAALPEVLSVIPDGTGPGPRLIDDHLF